MTSLVPPPPADVERTYRVRAVTVRQAWATVTARSADQARHLVMVTLDMAEEQVEDDVDAVDYDWPSPIDELAAWIDRVEEASDGEE